MVYDYAGFFFFSKLKLDLSWFHHPLKIRGHLNFLRTWWVRMWGCSLGVQILRAGLPQNINHLRLSNFWIIWTNHHIHFNCNKLLGDWLPSWYHNMSPSFVFTLKVGWRPISDTHFKEVWLNVTKIVSNWDNQPASKRPSSSYLPVKKGVEDELPVAKLSVFNYITSLLQPYLTKYQTDHPVLLFLGKDLERFHRSLLQLVIKSDVLEKCESPAALLQFGFSDKSIYLKLKNIHFGFSM